VQAASEVKSIIMVAFFFTMPRVAVPVIGWI
jgi:hypothetical protein